MNIHNIIRITLLLPFFGLLFMGCKKDNSEKKDNGLIFTVLSPGFQGNNQITRAAGDQVKASPEESKIYSLVLLVFNESGSLIYKDYVFSDAISTESKVSSQSAGLNTMSTKQITNEFNSSTNEDKYTFQIDPKQLDLKKKYTIVALANPQSMYLSMKTSGISTAQSNGTLISHFDKSPMMSKSTSTTKSIGDYLSDAQPLIDSISKHHFPLDLGGYGLPMIAIVADRPIPVDHKVKLPLERMVSKLIINRIDATEFEKNIRSGYMTGSGAGSGNGVYTKKDGAPFVFMFHHIQRALTYHPLSVSLTASSVGSELSGDEGFFTYRIDGNSSGYPNAMIMSSDNPTPKSYSIYLPQANIGVSPLNIVLNIPYTFVMEKGESDKNYGNDPNNNWYKINLPMMKGNYIYECNVLIVNRGGLTEDKAVEVSTKMVVRKWDTLERVDMKFDDIVFGKKSEEDGYWFGF